MQRLPRQIYLWSSAFLQSAFYFDALLKSPFKALKRRARRRADQRWIGRDPRTGCRPGGIRRLRRHGRDAAPGALLSVVSDIGVAMPVTWGAGTATEHRRRRLLMPANAAGSRSRIARRSDSEHTERYGRPVGWALMASAVEKIGFPMVLLAMVFFQNWEGLLITVGAETLITVAALAMVMKRQRLEYVVKGIAVTPIRYALLACELVTIARFASDMWLTRNRRWRK